MNDILWVGSANFVFALPRVPRLLTSTEDFISTLCNEADIYQSVPGTESPTMQEAPDVTEKRLAKERDTAKEQIGSGMKSSPAREPISELSSHQETITSTVTMTASCTMFSSLVNLVLETAMNNTSYVYVTATTYTYIARNSHPTSSTRPRRPKTPLHIILTRTSSFATALHAWRLLIRTRTRREWLQYRCCNDYGTKDPRSRNTYGSLNSSGTQSPQGFQTDGVPPLLQNNLQLWFVGENGSEELGDVRPGLDRFVLAGWEDAGGHGGAARETGKY